ncbi:MAG TPA: phospholipase D-like domain-containing protein [Pyrinomonadaceae bacterium]|jgi:phosphatidylserine/phosphatidylglycerophosphate/cardiolipin synthase-like enzyme
MTVKLKVYVNEDDALLFWSIPKPIKECRGFAIQRRIKRKGKPEKEHFLVNRTGFANEKVDAKPVSGQKAVTKPSTEWPFQRFSWTDHDAQTGDTVSYRVIPVIREDGALKTVDSDASSWSPKRVLGTTAGKYKPFFNRGFVMSQFMARYLAEHKLSLAEFKAQIRDASETIGAKHERNIRLFLSGDLRLALLNELKIALDEGGQIFAALFELSDTELIDALCKLKGRANVVLANGSVQAAKGEGSAAARLRDENEDARKKLLAKGVDVKVQPKDRFLSPGALGHNKFLVRTDRKGKPLVAWTGSTNWAPTGLCTQVNNGLLIEDAGVAQVYLDQWHALLEAKSTFPKPFVEANSQPKPVGKDTAGHVRSIVWFSRTKKGVDLEALREEVDKAREGILFLMFMPGSTGLFSNVAKRSGEPNLYVRGVVSELPNGRGDESAVDVNLIDGENHTSLHLDIVQPEGVKHPFATFAGEVTRTQFLGGIGHAIIHSKVVVIDPFSADPVVITGSHNFSASASSKNDENFIIIKGDHELAEAYAVNIYGAYAHYRWRAFLSQTKKPFNGLDDNDKWLAPRLAAARRDLRFWGV